MTENKHGMRIAILIGTNEYSKVEKLEFAGNDAREMGKVLLDPDICGFDEVIELIDKNKEDVSKAIERVFKNAKKEDQVLIYYSGHGKPSYKFDLCLLFKDSDPESLLATSLKFDYINECKEQSACNRVVVILDCCYSGTAGMKGDFLQEMLSTYSGSGTILLTSTGQTGSNIAKEDKELKHGVFTHFLLRGLKDWAADYDNDGVITVDDLYRYTFNETKAKGLQRPQIKGSYEGEMILGRNPQKIRDREFEQKKEKLIQSLSSAPSFVLYKSLTILQKMYNNPSALETFEVKIKPHLESLLNDEIQVEAYVDIVKYQEKLRKQQEEEQKQKERQEEKGEKEEQERLRKQRDEKLQRQREEEEKARKEAEEKTRRELEEQERLRKQKEEDEKLEESKRKVQEEEDKRKKEQEEEERKEKERVEREREPLEEQERKSTEEEEKAKKEQEERERNYGEETESKKAEASKTQAIFSSLTKPGHFSGRNTFMISIFLGTILILISAFRHIDTGLAYGLQSIYLGLVLGIILIWILTVLYYLEIDISGKKILPIFILLGTILIWSVALKFAIFLLYILFGTLLIWISTVLQYSKTGASRKNKLLIGIFLGDFLIWISILLFFSIFGPEGSALDMCWGALLILISAILQYFEVDISRKTIFIIGIILGILTIWIQNLQANAYDSYYLDSGTLIGILLGTLLILIPAILQYSKT